MGSVRMDPIVCCEDDNAALADSVLDNICARANRVSEPRMWWGQLEWCIWGGMCGRQIFAIFGTEFVNLLEVFAPPWHLMLPEQCQPAYVVACRVSDDAVLPVEDLYKTRMNHWVAASRISPTVSGRAREWDLDSRPCATDLVRIRESLWPLGIDVHATVAQGDCGPDAATFLEGMPRDPQH